ncbi:MAG: universal stress protein [Phycisphaeraceae bacterium]|nr:universal stress protein [Phycisphaeraceae bacterium]MCP4795521.1 universal stress protein [Phycisphaeraceae bacterium]MCP4939522.1 universal stress protein [Phycisphaeraceae bacterium]
MSLKRLIVALGGSEYMESAVAEACQIARRNDAEIVGIAVMDETLVDPAESAPIGGGAAAMELRKDRTAAVEAGMNEAIATFTRMVEEAGIPHRAERFFGDAQEALSDALRLADLAIIGIRHAFDYGTIAHADDFLGRVARASGRPILAMTTPARPIDRVVVAYDGSTASADALRAFGVLNGFSPSMVRVVHCREDGVDSDRLLEEAATYLRLHGHETETLALDGSPTDAVLDHAEAWNADLVVMGAVGRRGLSRLFLGDTASRTLGRSGIPLLIRS